jgi:hypothetical protein
MVRRRAPDHALSVPVLLNEAQKSSASGHLRYAKVMWELASEDTAGTLEQVVLGMKLFMTVSEVGSHAKLKSFSCVDFILSAIYSPI